MKIALPAVLLALSTLPAAAMEPHTTREIVVGEGLRGVLALCALVVPFLVLSIGLEGRLSARLSPAMHAGLTLVAIAYAMGAVRFAWGDVPSALGVAGFVLGGVCILGFLAFRCDPWVRARLGFGEA